MNGNGILLFLIGFFTVVCTFLLAAIHRASDRVVAALNANSAAYDRNTAALKSKEDEGGDEWKKGEL